MIEGDLRTGLINAPESSNQAGLFDRFGFFVYGVCGLTFYPLIGGYFALQRELATTRFPENSEHYRIALDETNECIVSAFQSMREGSYAPLLINPIENIIRI